MWSMKTLSIRELKAGLSSAVAEVEAGESIVVTRHGEPVAKLVPARSQFVHVGARAGRGRLTPAVPRGTVPEGRYLEILLEDRGDR
jgi:prevent-host-death family protein